MLSTMLLAPSLGAALDNKFWQGLLALVVPMGQRAIKLVPGVLEPKSLEPLLVMRLNFPAMKILPLLSNALALINGLAKLLPWPPSI